MTREQYENMLQRMLHAAKELQPVCDGVSCFKCPFFAEDSNCPEEMGRTLRKMVGQLENEAEIEG